MTEQHQQAHWAQAHPARVLPPAVVSLSFTITRGKRAGWLVWSASDADGPTAYCSTLAEAWETVAQLMVEATRETNEPLYRPQQPMIAYQPQVHVPQVQAAPAPRPVYQPPAPQPQPQEPMPSFMDREAQERTNKLADQIAEVQSQRPEPRPMPRPRNGMAASWMIAAFGISLALRGALGV